MNNIPWQDHHRLDLLVDGELSREQYLETLRDMEDHPELWKQCAMRFLEQQALRSDMADLHLAGETDARPRTSGAARDRIWPWVMAAAASFMVAFAIGTSMKNSKFWSPADTIGVQDANARRSSDPAQVEVARQSENPSITSQPQNASPVRPAAVPPRPLTVFVHADDPQTTHVVDVPVRDWDENLADPLSNIPADVLQAMNRLGEVRIESQLMPVETGDGRHVLLPVNRLEITPVKRSYH